MIVGFTGTRRGMTPDQHKALCEWVKARAADLTEFHHGACVGADAEAHDVFAAWAPQAKRHAWPSTLVGTTSPLALQFADVVATRLPPLDRNRAIVNACDVLVACPAGPEELRSGTWSTIRYARRSGKPVVIIGPDGREEWAGKVAIRAGEGRP